MRVSNRNKLIAVLTAAGISTVMFQGCGKGFQGAGGSDLSSASLGTPPQTNPTPPNPTPSTPAVNTASYSYIAKNILATNCVSCHSPTNKQSGYDYSTYAATIASVNPNNAATSIMYVAVTTNMPTVGLLSSADIADIENWINDGAPNN